MKNEFLASRLAHGTADVPELMLWWPRHGMATVQYVSARAAAADEKVVRGSRESLVGLSREWEYAVKSAAYRRPGSSLGLMCEHSVLECTLVDAAFCGDPEGIERSAVKLMGNVEAHGRRYAKAVKRFPKARFEVLFKEHVNTFIGMVESLLANDVRAFDRNEKLREFNAAAIAALTAEWF